MVSIVLALPRACGVVSCKFGKFCLHNTRDYLSNIFYCKQQPPLSAYSTPQHQVEMKLFTVTATTLLIELLLLPLLLSESRNLQAKYYFSYFLCNFTSHVVQITIWPSLWNFFRALKEKNRKKPLSATNSRLFHFLLTIRCGLLVFIKYFNLLCFRMDGSVIAYTIIHVHFCDF